MTRDELIEKVARTMDGQLWSDKDNGIDIPSFTLSRSLQFAEVAINTIFDALKEPTYEMCFAGGEYVLSVGSIDCMHVDDRPEFGMKGRETGSYELFQAMLSASPLAPEE